MFKVVVQRFGSVLTILVAVLMSSAASGQTTVQIDPGVSIGPTILRAGWDIKAWATRLDTVNEARGMYAVSYTHLTLPTIYSV